MNEITAETRQELTTNSNDLLSAVTRMQVRSEVENNAMSLLIGKAKKAEKLVIEKMKPLRDSTKKAAKDAKALEDSFLNSLTEIKKIGLEKSNKWLDEEDAKRKALQRKIDEENERKEAKERERVAKLHAKAEAKGKVSTAVEKIIPQQVIAKVQAPSGVSYSETWSAEVTDLKALLQSILDGLNGKPGNHAIKTCVIPNMSVLNSFARMMKCESNIPGVIFKSKRVQKQRY